MKYLLSKEQCLEKRKDIEQRLGESGKFIMLTDKIPSSLMNKLPRCDDRGYVPLVYYMKENEEITLFCAYWTCSCGTLEKSYGLCHGGLKKLSLKKIEDLIKAVKGDVEYMIR